MLKKVLAIVMALSMIFGQSFFVETAGLADTTVEEDKIPSADSTEEAESNHALEVNTNNASGTNSESTYSVVGAILVRAESPIDLMPEAEDVDFYITEDDGSVISCSKDEINNKIRDSASGTTITLNRDVELSGYMQFSGDKKFIINLDGHTLSAVAGSRAMYINSAAEVTICNGSISGGSPQGAGWRRYGGAIYIESATLIADNVIFANNTARLGSAIYAAENYNGDPSDIQLNNCTVSNNSIVSCTNTTGTIHVYGSKFKANNLLLKNNTSDGACAGIFFNSANSNYNCELENCRIEGNTATATSNTRRAAAGLSAQNGNVILKNTVITNNAGMYVGGLRLETSVSSSNIQFGMTNSAIYNNTSTEEVVEGIRANDIVVEVSTNSITGIIPSASTMVDAGSNYDFSDKCWIGIKHDDSTDKVVYRGDDINLSTFSKGFRYALTCGEKPESVAVINADRDDAVFYETLTDAIAAANDGDTIRIINHDDPNVPDIINEQVIVRDKKITINLNGNRWTSADEANSVLTIEGTGEVTLIGPEDGIGVIGKITHSGAALTLNSHARVDSIILGDDQFVTLGEKFKLNGDLAIKLSSDVVDDEGRKLAQANSEEQAQELASKIKVSPLVASTKIVAIGKDVYKKQIPAVFVDGISGSDDNDGSSITLAVRTFEKAKQLAQEILNSTGTDTYIFVVQPLYVSDEETWELPEQISLNRYHPNRVLIEVQSGGELTLQNIVVDGQLEKIPEADKPLIRVTEGAILNVRDGAILKNNYHAPRYYVESGGAIHSKGTVNMSGGEISNNTSLMGGGIFATGENAVINFSGGKISGNTASKGMSGQTPSGGGIAVDNGAKLIMSGGIVENNKANNWGFGGGISIGVSMWYNGCKGSYLEMTGGNINANSAGENGGGIFVQSSSKAIIKQGNITNNACNQDIAMGSRGIYGGGGIYSNGPRNVNSQEIPQAEVLIYDAYISQNTANSGYGAGIAGCATSTTFLNLEGATVYNNNGSDQIFIDPTSEGFGDTARIYISEFAPGGGVYHWKDVNGAEKANDEHGDKLKYYSTKEALHLINDDAVNLDTEGKLAKVFIVGNHSKAYGGGVGSNGYVSFTNSNPNMSEEEVEISVSKVWDDQNDAKAKRPNSVTFNLLRKNADGEWQKVTFITMKPDDNGIWPSSVTFTGIPKKYEYKFEGETLQIEYEYKIEEEPVEGYKSAIKGNAEDGYIVTNTIESDDSSTPSEPDDSSTPSKPDDSSTPSKPDDSSTPSEPDDSSTPSEPDDSSTPSEPDDSSTPSEPDDSSTPSEPDDSSTPSKPDDSSTPSKPDDSSTPSKPDDSSTPSKPDDSSTPSKPDDSSTPSKPNDSSTPSKPDDSSAPSKPDDSSTPSKPDEETHEPDNSSHPTNVENPDNPYTGGSISISLAIVGIISLSVVVISKKNKNNKN